MINTRPQVNPGPVEDCLREPAVVDADGEIIVAILAGQPSRFRLLYRRHQQRVRSLLFQLCGPSALDDLVQEVFLRVWKGLPRMERRAKFTTWLYRITCNVASDFRRQAGKRRQQAETLQYEAHTLAPAPDLLELHYQDLVQRGLAVLKVDQRTVLVLHDLEGLAQKEVSEILRIPVGTVKSRLFHARQNLRQFLYQEGIAL
ncbi:sigma-70 family RNA polymerase sigma factor [Thermosynechococcaceae cyanobacterium BACA0444]|uniref:Sigma-70 family RNA polymerase sigma factor n=1 Tax=Pseudocalidococcus azoricus BACA0444 TaxID=2918990 RepID=A0AAE4FR63_9CYAN|nr:sigma-70 family RNA polymerase sigma factor [Pseudocalidococcus azoricus]MDS3860793.1 sigma-70 family RNA polymerase sigma factor [Pseudocalidococcus azoricus BACA0444]